jgi:RNA 3'-terminal phosphate cyclase
LRTSNKLDCRLFGDSIGLQPIPISQDTSGKYQTLSFEFDPCDVHKFDFEFPDGGLGSTLELHRQDLATDLLHFHREHLAHIATVVVSDPEPSMASSTKTLRFEGCALFRARIVSSILSGKTLIIKKIREDDQQPGLVDYEASFLRLVDKLLDGSNIEINETGTLLKFRPGIILGGEISHECVCTRSIGWYLEGILPILIFAKKPARLLLSGVTNNQLDLSVDTLRIVTLPLLRNFGIEGMNLLVKQRGAAPNGGGLVEFTSPIIRELRPINITEAGLVKRVRGVAFCAKMSPTVLARVVDSARGVLNDYLPDVYINTDHYRGKNSGASPGFSLALQAGLPSAPPPHLTHHRRVHHRCLDLHRALCCFHRRRVT